MFKDAWAAQTNKTIEYAQRFKQDAHKLEQEINQLLGRIIDVSSPRVIKAYETLIDALEKKKLILQEKAEKIDTPRHSFDELFELSMTFLSNPYKIWCLGKFNLQRIVLKLVFAEPLVYCRKTGYRIPKTALPFKALGDILGGEKKWCPHTDSNCGPIDYKSIALPTEL